MEVLHGFEAAILLFLQNFVRTDPLTALLVPLTHACEHGEIWIILGVVLLIYKPTRKAALLALLSLLLCWACSELLVKTLVARPRPFTAVEGLIPGVAPPGSFSFPSGHSCASLSTAGAYWRTLKQRWLRWGILVTALLIAFSRLYLGVHYPTDVLAGGLWGWFGSGLVVRTAGPKLDRTGSESAQCTVHSAQWAQTGTDEEGDRPGE